MYPVIYMVSCAFRERNDMNNPSVIWIPQNFTLSVIKDTIKAMDFGNTLKNTLFLNVGCSLVQVCSCAVTGYGFARFSFRGKKFLFGIVIMMIIVPPQIISLPLYTQFMNFGIKGLFTVNLIDNMLTMYLPALTGNGIRSGLMILIFRQFFRGLPKELEDAACIDGCGSFRTFITVMIPNALPAFLTVFLFSFVWYWNDHYMSTAFFINTKTVALVLENLDSELKKNLFNTATVQLSSREQIVWKEAGCLISITPVLLLYIFLQKRFTEGIVCSGLVM
ncbi:MAG: carbohydrate ABC transporter permease [Ruminococcus sp.]|nr:carbohydrate ABC transporter permease [Ruminococcus sp.]